MDKEIYYDLVAKQQALDYIKYVCHDLLSAIQHNDSNSIAYVIVEKSFMGQYDICLCKIVEEVFKLIKENRDLKAKLNATDTDK